MYSWLAITGVSLFTFLFAMADVITEVKKASDVIRSSDVNPGTTNTWKFSGLPNMVMLVVFNISQMKNVQSGELRIYEDNIQPYLPKELPKCMVYHARDIEGKSECFNVWRKEYGSCVLNTVTTDCTVSFTRTQANNQEFVMSYDVVYCGRDQRPSTGAPSQTSADETFTLSTKEGVTSTINKQTTEGTELKHNSMDIATILPIIVSAILVVLIVSIVVCTVQRKKKPPITEATDSQDDDDERIYEEIDDTINNDLANHSDDPYNHLHTIDSTTVENANRTKIVYNTININDKTKDQNPVVEIVIPPGDPTRIEMNGINQ